MNEIKLLPCPFCGEKAVVHVNDGVKVICRECGASSKCLMDGYSHYKPDGSAIEAVVKAWNTRKPMEQIAEQLNNNFRKVICDEDLEWNRAIDMAIDIVQRGGADDD